MADGRTRFTAALFMTATPIFTVDFAGQGGLTAVIAECEATAHREEAKHAAEYAAVSHVAVSVESPAAAIRADLNRAADRALVEGASTGAAEAAFTVEAVADGVNHAA